MTGARIASAMSIFVELRNSPVDLSITFGIVSAIDAHLIRSSKRSLAIAVVKSSSSSCWWNLWDMFEETDHDAISNVLYMALDAVERLHRDLRVLSDREIAEASSIGDAK